MMADDRFTQAEKEALYDKLLQLDATFGAKIAEDQQKAAESVANTWKQVATQMSDAFATAATDMIMRTKSVGAAISSLLQSVLKDTLESTFKGLFNSILGRRLIRRRRRHILAAVRVGGIGGMLGLPSGGLSGMLGGSGGLLGGLDSLFSSGVDTDMGSAIAGPAGACSPACSAASAPRRAAPVVG